MTLARKQVYLTRSREETEDLGKRLAALLSGISAVALYGELGAGKTAFTAGLARGMGYLGRVSSPTYTIVNEYPGARNICHFDLYRLGSPEELYDIGWDDYLASSALCVVEWSEHAEGLLPENTLRVCFRVLDGHTREIAVCPPEEKQC